jgi:hypothetical protein
MFEVLFDELKIESTFDRISNHKLSHFVQVNALIKKSAFDAIFFFFKFPLLSFIKTNYY